MTLDLKTKLSLNFQWVLKFLRNSLYMFTNLCFYWVAASIDNSRSLIDTSWSRSASFCSTIKVRVEWQLVLLFHHVNSGSFLLLPLERRDSNTSRNPVGPTVETILLSLETGDSNTCCIWLG